MSIVSCQLSISALLLACTCSPTITGKQIYIPQELRANDFSNPQSQWSYHNAALTDNLVIFWENKFGPDLLAAPPLDGNDMTVDIELLKDKLEQFYTFFRDTLQFTLPGSKADSLRMMVMLNYSLEGTAYGGDYDQVIGALWVAPNRIHDKQMNCMAHELGHSFQSQITCDGQGIGWGGCGFYEMASQWMLWQVNPNWIADEEYHWKAFCQLTHKAFLHIENIYHSPYILQYWAQKHGKPFIAKLFREGLATEDPAQTYMRTTGMSQSEFCDEMYDASAHIVNLDFAHAYTQTRPYALQMQTKLEQHGEWLQPSVQNCPENYGFNVIELQPLRSGQTISINFEGVTTDTAYTIVNPEKAGWRYGFVATDANGQAHYSTMGRTTKGTLSYTPTFDTQTLSLVVMGAPKQHWQNPQPNALTDAQWPYRVKLTIDNK